MTTDGQPDRPELHPVPGWGHALGILKLKGADVWSEVPATLLAEVQQCVNRYCWGFDDRRLDILTECFTNDGTWEATVMGEVCIGPFVGREKVLEWLTRFWKYQRDQRRHIFTNFIVDEYSGNEAVAYAYLQLVGSSDSASSFESAGFCRFDLRREGSRWAIRSLSAGFDSPFFAMKVEDMSPRLRELFGIIGE